MSIPEHLHRSILPLQFTDSEIKRICANAAAEATRIMSILSSSNASSAAVRSAQIALAKANAEMWGNVLDATKVGIGDAVWNATEAQALFDEGLFASAGFSSQYWRASMLSSARVGIDNIIARKENGITLAQSVWKQTSLSKGYLEKAINNGLLLGKSQREIAKDVIKYVNPNVPGGASYAALRLARSEVNNAYHTTAINRYKDTPWVDRVRWNLSGSHPKPDECNEYSEGGDFPKEPGLWKPDNVPAKPHPNCLCYVTPEQPDLEKFAKDFKAGKFDDYIDGQMGCYRGA